MHLREGCGHARTVPTTKNPPWGGFSLDAQWRPGSESNRRTRLCRPLHDHSATRPLRTNRNLKVATIRLKNKTPGVRGLLETGAGNETRTRDPDLGKVVLYQLSYSRIRVRNNNRSTEFVKSLRATFLRGRNPPEPRQAPIAAVKPSLVVIDPIHDSVAVGRQGLALWGFWQQSVR